MFAVFRRCALLLAVAVATLLLALDGGSSQLSARNGLAVVAWWSVALSVAVGTWPVARLPRLALAAGALLAAFAAWTLASVVWAPSAEQAVLEFDRAALYLGAFLVAVLAATRGTVARWVDGIAFGLTAVAGVALASRLFPSLFNEPTLSQYLPSARTRLSFPVQYWNGLGILVALAFPLLLRAAIAGHRRLARGAAVAPLPVVAATIYLTSSRGAAVSAVAGGLATLTVARRRWRTLGALTVAAAGGAGAAAILLPRHALVERVGSSGAASEGALAAILLVLLCVAMGVLWGMASGLSLTPPQWLGRALAVGATAIVLGGVAAAHPLGRFDAFKRPPAHAAAAPGDFTRAHLLSGNSSGRWQFWTAAVDEWRSAPLRGRGAGSYESWWARNGSISYFVRDAHSLYLETAAELGLVGLALLVGALGCGVAAVVARSRAADDDGAAVVAALAGALAVYLVGAGIDWMWELTIVSLVGFVCLGLLVGPATEALQIARRQLRHRFALGIAVVLAGWLLICAEAVPLIADAELRSSQRAAARGDDADALSHAETARKLEPWAASPYLQLALVAQEQNDLPSARAWINEAISRDSENWRPYLVAARIEADAGHTVAARRFLHRAAALDPRSPLFVHVDVG